MIVSGECKYVSAKTGLKKDGASYFMVKFLDEDADEFFTCFVDSELFNGIQGVPKKTPVLLTMCLVPGQKYVKLENIEVLSVTK